MVETLSVPKRSRGSFSGCSFTKKNFRFVPTGDRKLKFRYDVATGVAHTSVPSDLKNLKNSISDEFFREGM